MAYYAQFNTEGFVLGFYDDLSISKPDEVVEVSEEQYLELLTNQAFRRWDGKKVVEYTPPEATPAELRAQMPPITKRQLRLTLVRNGISLGQVEQSIAAMPEGLAKQEAEIEWRDASQFNRLHPTLLLVATALSLTTEQVDAMWEAALTV